MRIFQALIGVILATTAAAEPLRLILVPQQVVISRDGETKFDVYLYNDGNSAATVPSLESFSAFYFIRRAGNEDAKVESDFRKFSRPIKDHTLKAHGVDHTIIDLQFSPGDGDYLELSIEVGNKQTLRSNSVILYRPKENETER
jgi:hypothetical protein